MWYLRDEELHWRLKITLKDGSNSWLTCAAFDVPARKLFNNLSAKEASDLQQTSSKEFVDMFERVKKSNLEHAFCVYVKENNWNTF